MDDLMLTAPALALPIALESCPGSLKFSSVRVVVLKRKASFQQLCRDGYRPCELCKSAGNIQAKSTTATRGRVG